MATAHSPVHALIKAQFGLDEGDDFESEPTSVLDLTQCISPPLQPDAWAEQQQQAAIWELNLWQHQQTLLWEHQLREEQQLWEEQHLQNVWEQHGSSGNYMNGNYQTNTDACEESSSLYQSYDGFQFQQQQLLLLQEQQQLQSSNINSLPSFDDYEAQFMLDSWISCSGSSDVFSSLTTAETDSSPYLLQDGTDFPEFDHKFQSEAYGIAPMMEEDENDGKFSRLDVTNSGDYSLYHSNNNNNNNTFEPSGFLPPEDPLYLIHHGQQASPVPQLQQLSSHDLPYSVSPPATGAAPVSAVSDDPIWHEMKVIAAEAYRCEKLAVAAAAANSENSVSCPPDHHSPTSGVVVGLNNNSIQSGLGTPAAAAAVRVNSFTTSRETKEDCLSIISTVTSTTKSRQSCLPPTPSERNSKSSVAAALIPESGSGRVVTLAELASGGVKMGGVQLPSVGTQIPSVIRLAVETQASSGMGGIRMVQLLLACAEAVACRDSRQANILLQQLQHMATPYGDAMQRITACFVEGLTARLAISGSQPFKFSSKPPGPRKPPSEMEKLEGFQLVYRVSPFLAFGHLAANSAILEAFEKEDKLHIVDLGMSHALQWPYLIHDLATRTGGPPSSLRITGFGLHSAQLKEAGEELSQIAKARNIPFEFRAVTESLENMQRSMLELRQGEILAVNSVLQLHCVVKESRGSLNAVLQTIHELSPKVLTLVEQDASHNGPFFLGRFMEALHYYSAIFDSLDVILPRNCPYRVKIEQFHFAEEITNIVSCEGPARVERHERVDQWRRKMSRAGFQPLPLKFLSQARMWLSHYNCDGYTLSEEKGCLVMGWKGKPIIAASSWKR